MPNKWCSGDAYRHSGLGLHWRWSMSTCNTYGLAPLMLKQSICVCQTQTKVRCMSTVIYAVP